MKKGMTTVSITGKWGSSLHNYLYTVRVRAGATVHRNIWMAEGGGVNKHRSGFLWWGPYTYEHF